ncbi:MAG: hypothetical protein H0X31_00865 [Nostocaceae cyanobacterium]|nr:hypothetical protein [Nostocaceae cyanobacterium]
MKFDTKTISNILLILLKVLSEMEAKPALSEEQAIAKVLEEHPHLLG